MYTFLILITDYKLLKIGVIILKQQLVGTSCNFNEEFWYYIKEKKKEKKVLLLKK